MKIELPDIDIGSASEDELKEHSDLCAAAENRLRGHTISVHFQIIKLVNARNASTHRPGLVSVVRVRSSRGPSVRDMLAESLEELTGLDDFR
jgi:hypothetical protein